MSDFKALINKEIIISCLTMLVVVTISVIGQFGLQNDWVSLIAQTWFAVWVANLCYRHRNERFIKLWWVILALAVLLVIGNH